MNEGAGQIDIVLIEDSLSDAKLVLRALDAINPAVRVHLSCNGAEALDYLLRRGEHAERDSNVRPKLILLDLHLPKLDGAEILRQLKSNHSTRTIPIIVFTSSDDHRNLYECYLLGANSYVVKPVIYEVFKEAVRRIGLYWLETNRTTDL